MKRLIYSAGVLVFAVLFSGCVQTDRHNRYPVERGGYEDRNRDHDRDRDRDRDRNHNWDRDDNRDRDDRDRDDRDRDHRDRDDYRDRDNGDSDRDSYRDRDSDNRHSGRDDGERAIMSYIQRHEIPVRVTGIEPLPDLTVPAAPGKPGQTLARYRVSVESTGPLKAKADRIVSYNPDTGELSLER